MRIKRLTAGLLACVLMVANLSTVCFAAETETVDNSVTAETASENETTSEDADTEQPSVGENSTITIPYSSIEEWQEAISENEDSVQEETVSIGTVNVSGSSYLNLRSGSGMNYGVIGHLFAGDEVEIVGEDGDWYQVVVKERSGYVHKDYVDVSEQTVTDTEIDSEMMAMLLYLMMAGQMGTDGGSDSDAALTPDGNLTLVDDYSEQHEDGSGKQFITVTTKDGNYFYLVIDRDEDGNENVHFMNLVDEADLLALMDEDEAAKYTEPVEPEEPVVTEPAETTEPEEPVEEPEEKSGTNMLPVLILVIALLGGGGFFAYTKLKGKQIQQEQEKPDPDADYLDGEDETDFELPEDFEEDEEDESTMFDAEDDEPV